MRMACEISASCVLLVGFNLCDGKSSPPVDSGGRGRSADHVVPDCATFFTAATFAVAFIPWVAIPGDSLTSASLSGGGSAQNCLPILLFLHLRSFLPLPLLLHLIGAARACGCWKPTGQRSQSTVACDWRQNSHLWARDSGMVRCNFCSRQISSRKPFL